MITLWWELVDIGVWRILSKKKFILEKTPFEDDNFSYEDVIFNDLILP